MPSNKAAWIEEPNSKPFVVKDAPYTSPGEGEIVIKNSALAINPADPLLQANGSFPWITYPTVYGLDISGVVEEVGTGVEYFKKGDRVIAAVGVLNQGRSHANGGFQLYTVISAIFVCPLPTHISFDQGVVIPLCWFTAAGSLFDENKLALNLPSLSARPQNKTVLVWGGSSSVGSNALQLLRNAGYDILTTASAKNHDFVKSLGATAVVDYNSPNVKVQLLESLKGKTLAGIFDCIGSGGTLETCIQIALEHPDSKKAITSVTPGQEKLGRDGVHVSVVLGTSEIQTYVSGKVWKEYMPTALQEGKFLPKPDPEIVGHGLEAVQKAVDQMAAGVSAKKLVVTL